MPLDPSRLKYERFDELAEFRRRQKELLASPGSPPHLSIEQYDSVFDLLFERLNAVGSISDGGLTEAGFSVSRFVDPTSEITVVVNSEDKDDVLVPIALRVLEDAQLPFAITFDTGSYVSVLSTGHVLGYSNWEQLRRYGFPEED